MARLVDIKLIKTPVFNDCRGNLSFLESHQHIPFDIKRVYYLYDVPGGFVRGGHAHYDLQQMIIAVNGSFDITLDDGFERTRIRLDSPSVGLLLPTMIWRDLDNFSAGTVCLVLASEYYNAADYIRNYDNYIELVNPKEKRSA